MSAEMLYGALVSLVVAIFWHWVRSIDKRHDQHNARHLRHEQETTRALADIRMNYQRRDDAHREIEKVYDLLKDIKTDMARLLDRMERNNER